jgi:toxin-antitoxin system PIN domain toxin
MSCSIDANLLLYASDAKSPFHTRALDWLETQIKEPEILYVTWPVAFSYLRIATHPRIFESPLTPAEALANLHSLKSLPRVRFLPETENLLDVYSRLTVDLRVRGNLVPDAQLAAILFQHGVRRLYTNDSDFRKFDFLDVRNPFAA